MQAHQFIIGFIIFVLTAGIFIYSAMAANYFRTKVIEKKNVEETKKIPSPIVGPQKKETLEPLKKRPVPSAREEHPVESKSHATQLEETGLDLEEESATRGDQEDISSQRRSSDLFPSSIEGSEEEVCKAPETLYIHSCDEIQAILDNFLLSENLPSKDELIRIFFEIELKCRDQISGSIYEYIKDLYERKIVEFIEQKDNRKLITTSDKINLLFKMFQIEPRSMQEDMCSYLRNELEEFMKHSETGEGQRGPREKFQVVSKAFAVYCTQN
jgi:hypothetical protein